VGFSLRQYQADAVADVRAKWRAGARRILLVMPVGSGKTKTAVSVVESAMRKGRVVLWLTHRTELVAQASSSLRELGIDHGIVQAGKPRRPDLPMQVASVQTLARRGERPEGVNVIVIDESHHVTARTWRGILDAYPGLELVLGLTATPQRGDGTPLGDVFEAMVVATSVAALQASGSLVPCRVFAPANETEKLSEDPVDAYVRLAAGRRAIVFATNVPEAHRLAAAFSARGIHAACVEGGTDPDERRLALERLATGQLRVVVNVFCLTEGTDVPAVECVIIARGCSTDAAWMQSIGRGLRPSPGTGKRDCIVIDLRGCVHVHGLPEDARVFSLAGKASKLAQLDAAPLPPVVSCRSCLAWHRGGGRPCPSCGAMLPKPPPPRVSKRELALVTAEKRATAAAARGDSAWLEWCAYVNDRRSRGKSPQAIAFGWKVSGRILRYRVQDVPEQRRATA
jgi:superfamily II DNA or RNA helicase